MFAPNSFDFFNARLNAVFGVAGYEGVQLELSEAAKSVHATTEHQAFSLTFRGPADPLLPQQIYTLESPADGALEIFLVPVARDKSSTQYEAVFS
jgi:hypothetical protein